MGGPCGRPSLDRATARVAPTAAHTIIVLVLLLTTLPQKAAQLPR